MDEQRLKDTPAAVCRFDLTTPRLAKNREQNAATCKVDLKDMLQNALKQQDGEGKLPSEHCYIENLAVEDASNSLPVDVHVTCKQNDRVYGNFHKSKLQGEEASHRGAPSLFVVHSGQQIHSDNGREIYRSGDFVKGKTFRNYLQALKKDIEDSATPINGGQAVEYVSPFAVLTKDNVVQGDWLVDTMYKNPKAFKHCVQAIRTPVDNDGKYICSMRMHAEDWTNLNKSVQSHVVQPLRQNIIDLNTDSELHFNLEPDVHNSESEQSNSSIAKRSAGVHAWHHPEVKGQPGRAAVTMRATVRFV